MAGRGIPKSLRSFLFFLGVRPAYKVEVSFAALALALLALSEALGVATETPVVISLAMLVLAPAVLQIAGRYYRARYVPKERRASLPPPRVPLLVVIASAAAAVAVPALLPAALINAALIEDIVPFMAITERYRIKRGFTLILEPLARVEMATTLAMALAPSIVTYFLVGNPVVFVYPAIAYAMIAYSLVTVPPEVQEEARERGAGILETMAARLPILYFVFRAFYFRPDMVRQGKEAGLIGNKYYEFVRRAAGAFALGTYVSIALAPALYLLLRPLGLGLVGLLLPAFVAPATFVAPVAVIKMMRNNREGKISRNLLLILTYLSSMASVAERFTNSMEYLKRDRALARMFGMEREADIYMSIYSMTNDESVAMKDYADTVPDDFYRDTIRTVKDLVEAEGYGAAFRSLTARIRDYTTRFIDRVSATFQDIGSNVISVIMLVETAVPIFAFLSSPMMAPLVILAAGAVSGLMMGAIAMSTMPDLPSDFVHAKQRMRRGAMIFALSTAALTALERPFFSGTTLVVLAALNAAAGVGLALDYSVRRDLAINGELLNKFPDILMLFSSSIIQTNSVERSLRELSQQTTLSGAVKAELRRLANMFSVLNVERISYKGVYWYKYFTFLARIAAAYGTAPRDLYKTIGDFMLEFKKFFSSVASFGASLLFLTMISLAVLNMEMVIMISFSHVLATYHLGAAAAGVFSFASPIPVLTEAQAKQLELETYVAMLVTALANGFGLARVLDGTFRAGRWAFLMYFIELVLIIVGAKTGFGFARLFTSALSPSPGASATP